MKPKMKIKLSVDLLMTVALLLLMAYQVVGEVLHEWFGAAMLLLFIVHTVLNYKWYTHLFKGKYTVHRAVGTVLNLAVLIAILCTGYSGIVMSRHLFTFLQINGGMALARMMHLAASYWGFVLMSLHLGMHMSMIGGLAKKAFPVRKSSLFIRTAAKIVALLISAYGVYSFITEKIADNLFLKTQFVFFDYEASAFSVFCKYISMMILFATIAYCLSVIVRKNHKKTKEVTVE